MIDRLIEKIIEKENPSVVGLDTSFDYLPENMRAGVKDFAGAAEAIVSFNRAVIDAVSDVVPAVKVQIAYYEMYGTEGLRAFPRPAATPRERG